MTGEAVIYQTKPKTQGEAMLALVTASSRSDQRERFYPLIQAILERGPAGRCEICAELGLNPNTGSIYLRALHEAGVIRRGPPERNNSFKWELGEDESRDVPVEGSQRTVVARQVGMSRDVLVAALFGPARGVTA